MGKIRKKKLQRYKIQTVDCMKGNRLRNIDEQKQKEVDLILKNN